MCLTGASGLILTASKPCSTRFLALAAACSGVSPPVWLYMRILSRTRPPISSYTGAPSFLPLMSQRACSMPLMQEVRIGPPR